METTSPIEECFERAAALERKVQRFYSRIAMEFRARGEISRFFSDLAVEEAGHAKLLENASRRASWDSKVEVEARQVLEILRNLEPSLDRKTAPDYENFDQVLARVNRIEKSELNKVFSMLITGNFSQVAEPLADVMDPHIQKLVQFEEKYPPETRRTILPAR